MTPNFKYSKRIFTHSWLKQVSWRLRVRQQHYSRFFTSQFKLHFTCIFKVVLCAFFITYYVYKCTWVIQNVQYVQDVVAMDRTISTCTAQNSGEIHFMNNWEVATQRKQTSKTEKFMNIISKQGTHNRGGHGGSIKGAWHPCSGHSHEVHGLWMV